MGWFSNTNTDELTLRPVHATDESFIRELFSDSDVRKFYILLPQHQRDLSAYVKYLCVAKGIYRIVELDGESVGIVCAEVGELEEDVAWNVSYAILPQFRGNHYAAKSVLLLKETLKNYNIPNAYLQISMYNEASQSVAKLLGLTHTRTGDIDPNHMELGMMLRWVLPIHSNSKRMQLCRQAFSEGRVKHYQNSILLYEQALKEDCDSDCPFTDAQIYSNLGMSYSSLGNYQKAYELLMRAYNMGLRNPSVIKELNWLRTNGNVRF